MHYPIYAFLWLVSIQPCVISWLWGGRRRWDAVCISLRQNEMDQYSRGGWIRGPTCVCERACACVCVSRQTALGDQSTQLLVASSSVSFLSLLHTRRCFSLHAQVEIFFFFFFWSGQKKISAETIYSHSISACDRCFSLPLALVSNFMKPYFFSDAAGWRAGGLQLVSRLLSFKRRFTSCLRQELGCPFFFFFFF